MPHRSITSLGAGVALYCGFYVAALWFPAGSPEGAEQGLVYALLGWLVGVLLAWVGLRSVSKALVLCLVGLLGGVASIWLSLGLVCLISADCSNPRTTPAMVFGAAVLGALLVSSRWVRKVLT